MKIVIEITKKQTKIYAVAKCVEPGCDTVFEQRAIDSGSKTVRDEVDKLMSAIEEDGTCRDLETS